MIVDSLFPKIKEESVLVLVIGPTFFILVLMSLLHFIHSPFLMAFFKLLNKYSTILCLYIISLLLHLDHLSISLIELSLNLAGTAVKFHRSHI